MSADTWIFGSGAAEIAVPIHSRLAASTAEAAVDAAAAGIGLTRVLSYQVQAATEQRALQVVLEGFEPPPIPINLVHAGQSPLPLKVRAFLDFAAPRLRERLRGHP
jgi:DNA-binding transcriptional LysR family regulator